MPSRLGTLVRPAAEAVRVTLADPGMRGLMIGWFTVNAGKWALLVTNLVVAYELGGVVGVGIISVARYLAPALVAPLAGLPTARWAPESVLRVTNATRTMAVVATIVVIATDASLEALAVAVAVEAAVGAFSRPVHMGLLPAMSRTPEQLIGANVTSSAGEGLGTFAGPALGSVLLLTTGPIGAAFAVVLTYAIGVLAIARLHVPTVGRVRASGGVRAVADDLTAGVRAAATLPGPRLVILGLTLQCIVRGLLTVLVVLASIELLGLGEPGVGSLNAAMGLGGVIGAVAAFGLAGRDRLGPAFAIALAGWGAPIALMGVLPIPAVAVVAMAAVGCSNALLDVSGFTLAQRTAPNSARVALLGLIDGAANLAPAIGGLAAPLLVQVAGIRGALVTTGLILPIAAISIWGIVRRLDEGGPAAVRRVELLRAQPLFAPLSLATIEYLAGCLIPIRFGPGDHLMREGEAGDRYVLIDDGEAEVDQGGTTIARLGPGAGIGEIALVRDVPRTASVRAVSPIAAFSLGRDAFLEAVTGHPGSREAAEMTATERLAADARRSA